MMHENPYQNLIDNYVNIWKQHPLLHSELETVEEFIGLVQDYQMRETTGRFFNDLFYAFCKEYNDEN